MFHILKTISHIIFSIASSVGLEQVICEYDLYPIYFLLLVTNFNFVKSFFVTIIIKWASVDIIDDEGSFEFSTKAEFTSPLYIHITLATDTKAPSSGLEQLLQC